MGNTGSNLLGSLVGCLKSELGSHNISWFFVCMVYTIDLFAFVTFNTNFIKIQLKRNHINQVYWFLFSVLFILSFKFCPSNYDHIINR